MFFTNTIRFLLICLFSVIIFNTAKSQVTIAPTNLFIDGSNRFGTYMVINGSDTPQEVSVDFIFGYATSDSVGNRLYIYDDSLKAETYSLASSIRAFPQNFTLNPNQRQVVRLRINQTMFTNDGTYWARIKTSSTPVSPPIELENDQSVGARIGVVIDQISGVFYKKGNVTTGIDIKEIEGLVDSDSNTFSVLTHYNRTGNSPFLGTITTILKNANGNEVRRGVVSTSIYFDGIHRENFDLSELPSGNYSIEVSFESSRTDVSSSEIVQMQTVNETTSYVIK